MNFKKGIIEIYLNYPQKEEITDFFSLYSFCDDAYSSTAMKNHLHILSPDKRLLLYITPHLFLLSFPVISKMLTLQKRHKMSQIRPFVFSSAIGLQTGRALMHF